MSRTKNTKKLKNPLEKNFYKTLTLLFYFEPIENILIFLNFGTSKLNLIRN